MSELGPTFNPEDPESEPVGLVSAREYKRAVKAESWPRLEKASDADKIAIFERLVKLAGGSIEQVTTMPEETQHPGTTIRSEHFEHYPVYRFKTEKATLYVCPASESYYRYDLYTPEGKLVTPHRSGFASRQLLADTIGYLLP